MLNCDPWGVSSESIIWISIIWIRVMICSSDMGSMDWSSLLCWNYMCWFITHWVHQVSLLLEWMTMLIYLSWVHQLSLLSGLFCWFVTHGAYQVNFLEKIALWGPWGQIKIFQTGPCFENWLNGGPSPPWPVNQAATSPPLVNQAALPCSQFRLNYGEGALRAPMHTLLAPGHFPVRNAQVSPISLWCLATPCDAHQCLSRCPLTPYD